MVDDARYRTLTFLNTYISAAALTKDDGVAAAPFHVCYSDPNYPIIKVFYNKVKDCIFSIGKATSEAIVDYDGGIIGYNEQVPITIYTVDTPTVTGEKLQEKAEQELRLEVETYWQGSFRSLRRMTPKTAEMGGWKLYAVEYNLTYERSQGDVETHVTGITISHGQAFMDDFLTMYSPTIYMATSDGGAGGSTIINTAHTQGNDYWNGKTVKVLTSANAGNIGETALISDFDTAGDVMTFAGTGFPAQVEQDDTYIITNWAETEDGNTVTPSITDGDFLTLTVSAAAGNKVSYLSYPNEATTTDNLALNTDLYPKVKLRYYTSDANIKAKALAVYSTYNYGLTEAQNITAGNATLLLAETSSTSWTVATASLTAAKTLDHIRLYANGATGVVYYDFVMVYRGDFPIPNCRYGRKPTIPIKNSELEVFGMSGNQNQNGGTGLLEVTHSCDVTKGTWTRSSPPLAAAETIIAGVFQDIAHNSKSEPWQWYTCATYPNMKCNLTELDMPEQASNTQQDWRLNFTVREKRVSDAGVSSETYLTRW